MSYFGIVPADIVVSDVYAIGPNKEQIPFTYSFAKMLAEYAWPDPRWQSDSAWLDVFDALHAKLHKKEPGEAFELSTDEREKLLTVMRAPQKASGSYPDWLRPELSPYFRAVMTMSAEKPKVEEAKPANGAAKPLQS